MSRVWAVAALVLLPFLSPFADAQGAAEWRYEDPVGDTGNGLFANPVPAGTSVPISRHADIVAVTITGEDENGITLSVHFDALKVGDSEAQTGYTYVSVDFQVAGSPVSYSAFAMLEGGPQADPNAPFLVDPEASYGYLSAYNEGWMELMAEVTVAENMVSFWIPKPFLMGIGAEFYGDDLPVGLPASIGPGSSLTDIAIWVYGQYAPLLWVWDEMDGNAPPFVFQKPTANSAVRINLGAAYNGLTVQPGVNQTLPLIVTNVAPGKRILQMSYEIDGPADQAAKYRVAGPATLTLPAGATRNFTFALDVAPGAAVTDRVNLTVRAKSVGFEDEKAYAKTVLVPTPALGPDSNALYMLARRSSFQEDSLGSTICNTPFPFINCFPGMLSVDPQDAEAAPDQTIEGSGFVRIPPSESFWLNLGRATSAPVAFDPARPAEIQVTVQAPAPVDVSIQAELYAYGSAGDLPVFSTRGTGSVGTTPTALTVTAPLQFLDMTVLDRGTFFTLYLEFSPASAEGSAAFAAGGIEIVPGESKLVLPLVELPEAYKTTAKANPFQLVPAAGREEFVNPGEARLFNVSILHQGLDPERASLKAEVPAGWQVEILPGTQYDLQPGDTVTVGVLAHAPADAKENDRISVLLNATDAQGDAVQLELIAIVTSHELPDDAAAFRADADAQAKLVEAKGDSPSPAFLLALAALFGAVLRRRKA